MTIAGKYELVKRQNFTEMLIKLGTPADQAKKANEAPSNAEFKVEGDTVTVILDTLVTKKTTVYILGKPVDEDIHHKILKSTGTLSGDVFTVTTKGEDGKNDFIKRVYALKGNTLEETVSSGGLDCILTYKKL